MDPKVYGKLLKHHRRGYGVDVEALHDRIPSGRSRKKAPDGISWAQKVAAVEKWFRGSRGCFQGIRAYIGKGTRSGEPQGAHEGGGCLVPSSLLPLRTLQVFWIASVPKITLPKVSFRLDSV